MRRRQVWAAQLASTPDIKDEDIPDHAYIDPNACPKCGRIVKQGKVLHQKHCKGK